MGVELDRKRARDEPGGGEKALLLTREDMAKGESGRCRGGRSRRGETFDGSRRVEGPNDSGRGGGTVSSCPSRAPEPSGNTRWNGWESCSKS
ncbi:hypothetical protein EPR50_G00125250 [Perca flavescens]|uniref:Uncharacterized protein n=1 Tax=Perca flavescens TaxID=8167 RepID=A0A484CP45_PERFV|nr:hypothetical protein EPR50_G00125250 [Perca flavescens]